MFLVQEGALALPEEDAVLRVTPMEPDEFEELVRGGAEIVSALPHLTVLVMRHKMGLDVPEGSEREVRLAPGEAAVLVGKGDHPGMPFRFRRVERLDAETPAGRLTVERAEDEASPGLTDGGVEYEFGRKVEIAGL